jgi:hypothetical protein
MLSLTCDRSMVSPVFSTDKTDLHDIAEILLTVAINTIILTLKFQSNIEGRGDRDRMVGGFMTTYMYAISAYYH